MDGLFTQLSDSGIECHIGNQYVGRVEFVDDIKLLSPSSKGLQLYVMVLKFHVWCSEIAKCSDCRDVTNCEIVINNIPLNNANKAVDLGHTLSTEKVLYLLPLLK